MLRYNRIFADLSVFNPHFDAHEYKQAGHVAVAIKATEGLHYVSPNHRGYCLQAGLHHIAVIHYHFGRPDEGNSPQAEAAHFLSTALRLAGGRDYLVLDLERATPQGWAHDPAWSRDFTGYVQEHSRFQVILYASRATLELSDNWIVGNKKRVWDADWSTNRDYAPHGYSVFARQFSDGALGPQPHQVAGVGQCDVDILSWQAFNAITRELP